MHRPIGAIALALTVLGGCRGDDRRQTEQSYGEAALVDDTSLTRAETAGVAAEVPTADPAVQVTPADGREVQRSLQFQLTDDNFARFVDASQRLSYLRAREPSVRAALQQGPTEGDEQRGLERLERNAQVSQAIEAAGLSVRDFFVMAIAVASAERFLDNPAGAPPTRVGRSNAEFLQGKRAELGQLRQWR
jgi:hypothetical protein